MNNFSFSQPVFYGRLYVLALCLVFIISMALPRFMGMGTVLLAGIALAGYRCSHGVFPNFRHRAFFWAAAIPALMALSAIWSIDETQSLSRALKTLPITLSGATLLILGRYVDADARLYFQKIFPGFVIAGLLFLCADLYSRGAFYNFIRGLDIGTDFNPSKLNRSTNIAVICTFFAAACIQIHVSGWKKPIALLIPALALLWKTDSQSAQMGFVVGSVFFLFFPARHAWAWKSLGIVLGLLIVASPWISRFLFMYLANLASQTEFLSGGYLPQRFDIWNFVSQKALERPWLGHGAGVAGIIKDYPISGMYWNESTVAHPHNFALQIWLEFGLAGALATGLFFWSILKSITACDLQMRKILGAVFVALVSVAAVSYGLWQTWWIGFFAFTLALAPLLASAGNFESENAK